MYMKENAILYSAVYRISSQITKWIPQIRPDIIYVWPVLGRMPYNRLYIRLDTDYKETLTEYPAWLHVQFDFRPDFDFGVSKFYTITRNTS